MFAIFWHALVFGLAPLLQKLAGLVLLPLYTHYISPEEYGQIEILSIITGLFGVVTRLELRAGLMRAWLSADDDAARAALFTASYRLLLILGGAGALLFLLTSDALSEALLGGAIDWKLRLLLASMVFTDTVVLACSATLQARLRSLTMVVLSMLQFLLSASLTVVGVVVLQWGTLGFFLGSCIASWFGLLSMTLLLRRLLVSAPGVRTSMAPVIRYSIPLLAGALLYFVVRNADRIAVSQFMSVSDLGLYAMGWTLANLLSSTVFLPLQASFDVWRYRFYEEKRPAADVAKFYRLAMALIAGAAILLNTFGVDAFIYLADARYSGAVRVLPQLSVAVLLQAGYSFLAAAFYVSGRTGLWLALFSAAAICQVGFSILLIPMFGLPGAGFGIIAANLLLYVGAARWGGRLWPVPYNHAAVAAIAVLLFALAWARAQFTPSGLVQAASWDALTSILFLTSLFVTRIVTPGDFGSGARTMVERVRRRFQSR